MIPPMLGLLVLLIQDYDTQELDFDYVDAVKIEDLNGDGRPDLIVQCGLDLKIFLQTAEGRYPKAPDRTVRFDDLTFLWMLRPNERGQYDFDSIVTMSSRGIHRLHAKGDKVTIEDLVVHPTMFEGRSTASGPPPYFDFSPDFTGDGKRDLLLFAKNHLFLMALENDSWVLRDKVECGIESGMPQWTMAYQPVTWSSTMPKFEFGDVNGDKKPDFLYYSDEQLVVQTQREDGRFAPAGKKLTLSQKKHGRRRNLVKLEVPPNIEDINGDGMLDVVYTEPSKGRVYVRYGIAGREDFSDPAEFEIPSSWNIATQFVDLSGKGPKTMVLWSIEKLGLSSGIEAFVSKKVTINGHLFDSDEQGKVSRAAKTKISLSIPFTIYLTRNTTEFPVDLLFEPNFDGDVNHDGLKDLVVAVGGTLFGWLGRADSILSAEPDFKIALDPPTPTARARLQVRDLNGDQKADIIVLHTDSVNEKARIEIKFSK